MGSGYTSPPDPLSARRGGGGALKPWNNSSCLQAEKVLWNALRNNHFTDIKFRRQHPLKWFIADFYCHEAKLVIEVDGGIHLAIPQAEHDESRTSEIENLGIHVLRITNEEIMNSLEIVLEKIKTSLQRSSPPSPCGEGAGG